MSPPRAPLACVLALGMACGGESGIIAEVHFDQTISSPPDVVTLEFAVGFTVDRRTYATDLDSFATGANVHDRDLRWEPFRLFVKDELSVQDAMVMVGVVGIGHDGVPVAVGRFAQAVPFVDGEVRLYPLELVPIDTQDRIRVVDQCFIWFDGSGRRYAIGIAPAGDADCDGDPDAVDCGPEDPSIGPTANELCDDDGANSDCDPDGLPAALEVCNGRDDDCNNQCDEGFDQDADGFTTCGYLTSDGCIEDPARYDCKDNAVGGAEVNPDATEVCDGQDNDCRNGCDDGFDEDGDLYTTCGALSTLDPSLCVAGPRDCAPYDEDVYPGAVVPCLIDIGECMTGTTSCVPGDGTPTFDGCTVHGSAVEVPAEMCQAYTTCLQQPPPEYWDCFWTVNTPIAPPIDCSWPVVDGTPCPGPVLFFSEGGATECSFYLVPETAETVEVVVTGSGTDCSASIDVTAVDGGNVDYLTIVMSTSTGLSTIFVKIAPFDAGGSCPRPDQISCSP